MKVMARVTTVISNNNNQIKIKIKTTGHRTIMIIKIIVVTKNSIELKKWVIKNISYYEISKVKVKANVKKEKK